MKTYIFLSKLSNNKLELITILFNVENKYKFLNLLKATRITRVLTVLTIILIPAAYTNSFPEDLILFFITPILIYSAFSIYNAHRDNDYDLPNYYSIVILILLITTIIISIPNILILVATCLWIILGLIYHTIARKMILGDALIAGITHFALPITISAMLVGMETKLIIFLALSSYFFAISIGPTTNLKDIKEDKKRDYKTLVNSVQNPKLIASIFLFFSLLILIIIYIILNINPLILSLSLPILIFTIKQIYQKKVKHALILLRLYLMISLIFPIWILTNNPIIIAITLAIFLSQIFIIIRSKKNGIL